MDTSAGAIYHQMVVFQNDPSQHELIFHDPSPETQAYIQTLVRGLGLEFEYSSITKSARIIRRPPLLGQPDHDEFFNFLDFEQACPLGGELPDAYGLPPSAEVNWGELFSSQDSNSLERDCDSLQRDGPMFSTGGAFPGLDFAACNFDENQDYTAMTGLHFHPDPSNAIPITGSHEEQYTPFAFNLDAHVLKTQAQTQFKRLDEFQTPQCSIPSTTTAVQCDIKVLLSSLGMSHYLPQFLDQGFDTWEAISCMTESDFDALGVKLGHRRKLQQLTANQNLAAEVPVRSASVRPSYEELTGTSRNDTELGQNLPSAEPTRHMSFKIPTKLAGMKRNKPTDISIMSAANEAQSSSSRRNTSREGSLSSFGSSSSRNRISKAFNRRGSIQEETYPGYQIWDSRSANSASSSIGSGASTGRRGPLSSAARVMANAVKAVKACWRCKLFRKPCDLELPCESCPKGMMKGRNNAAWYQLGCRRGDLKDQMSKIRLCPHGTLSIDEDAENGAQQVNEGSRKAIQSRQEALTASLTGNLSLLNFDFELELFVQSLEPFYTNSKQTPEVETPTLQILLPLHECLFFIAWEGRHCPKSRSILGASQTMIEQLELLRSAANYQAVYDGDKLIALSLICLRTCLEALQVEPECVQFSSHGGCDYEECKVECIKNVETCLEMFLNELSKVMFKKLNLRSRTWWLSAFYSFCIHGIVRRVLKTLICTGQFPTLHRRILNGSQCYTVENYLIIALRFFVATSGIYDPLTKSTKPHGSITSETNPSLETDSDKHFQAAREAVKQETWKAVGISGSMQYLQNLFEDNGQFLPCTQLKSPSSGMEDDLGSALQRLLNNRTSSHFSEFEKFLRESQQEIEESQAELLRLLTRPLAYI